MEEYYEESAIQARLVGFSVISEAINAFVFNSNMMNFIIPDD